MGRHTRQQLFSRFIVSTHGSGMKFPKKRYVQGVRPVHIVFSGFSSPRLKAWDVGVSKYDSFIFSKQTSPNNSKGRMK